MSGGLAVKAGGGVRGLPTFCKENLPPIPNLISPNFVAGLQRCAAVLPRGEQRVCKRSGRLRGETGCTERVSAEEAGRKALRSAPRAEP
jgi:hypothetical protein